MNILDDEDLAARGGDYDAYDNYNIRVFDPDNTAPLAGGGESSTVSMAGPIVYSHTYLLDLLDVLDLRPNRGKNTSCF